MTLSYTFVWFLSFAKDLYEIGNTRFSDIHIDYEVSIIVPIEFIHYFADTISNDLNTQWWNSFPNANWTTNNKIQFAASMKSISVAEKF